jgi:type IV pilus assembly protein PilC
MIEDIRKGSSLGDAVRAHEKYLPPYLIELIANGELGGNLDVMLRDLADYFEDRLEMGRHITQLMVGPAIRLAAAWFLGTFALRLLTVIKQLAADQGRTNFDMAGYMKGYWYFQMQAFLLFGTVFVLCVILARMGLFSWVAGAFTTHVWPLSNVVRKFGLARFFRTMSLLITSGLRADHCIERAAAAAGNPYIEKDLLKVVPRVKAGQTLVEAFAGSRYLTPLAREMLEVGEQTGKLPESLRKIAQYHLGEATHAVQVTTKFLTVVIILGVAALIGYIVITFFGTMYSSVIDNFMP